MQRVVNEGLLPYVVPYSVGWKSTQRAVRILESAVEAARVTELDIHHLSESVGMSVPTIYSYFPSLKDLVLTANLILLEEELTRIGRWAVDDGQEWDVHAAQQRLSQWCGSVLETKNALGRLQVASTARAVDRGPSALKSLLVRSGQQTTDRLRELQARRIISSDLDAFAQAQFMNAAGLLGWWNDALSEQSPVRSTPADVTLMFDRIATSLFAHSQQRSLKSNSSIRSMNSALTLPTIDPPFDKELYRILALEVGQVDDRHHQVARSALDLVLVNPTGDFNISELVASAGVPPKALYELFADKEQILRVVLTAFTTSTASSYIQSLQHLGGSKDPLRLISDLVNKFQEPGSAHHRLLRLKGYAAVTSVQGPDHLELIDTSARLAIDGLEAAQQAGLVRDDVPARTVISLILGVGGIRPVLDVLGSGLPDSVWSRHLDALFGGLLAVD